MPATDTRTDGVKFQFPQFELPKMEIPEAVRDVATKWIDRGKENFEKALRTTGEINDALQSAYLNATKAAADCGAKVTDVTRANTITAFDVVRDLMTVKSLPEAIEISRTGARKQFDALAAQNQELWTLSQQLASETIKPITEGLPKLFNAAGQLRAA